MPKKTKKKQSQKIQKNYSAQSLIEVVITMGLGLIIITGIAIVTISGLKSQQLSKNQSIATKLTQEGIEQMRGIRDRNCSVKGDATHTYIWTDDGSGTPIIYTQDLPGDNFILTDPSLGYCLTDQHNDPSATDPGMASYPSFSRYITLQKLSGVDALQITSIVTWSDYSGDHQSKLVTTFGESQ